MHELLLRAADWWLGTAIGGGLVLLAGYGLMRLARQPAARQRLGEYAVLAALIVAGLRLLPAWLPLPWTTAAPASVEPTPAQEYSWVAVANSADSIDPTPAAEPETVAPPVWTWHDATAVLMAGYLLVASGLAARWLLGQWALNRLLRQARPAAPRVRRLFKAMAADTLWLAPRLRRRTHLRVAPRLRAPVCFGLRRPAVLLPEPMDNAAEAQLRWVFAHELTHLRRRDPWSSWGFGLAQAVYFFLPWFWWVRRSVRLCQEYVADAAAAKAGAAPDEYAEFLVSLARGSAPPLGATGLGSSSDLLRRVQMLLQSSTRVQGSWPRGRSMLAAGGLLAVAVFAGGVGLRAESPDEESKVEVRKNVIVTTDGDAGHVDGEPVRVIVKVVDDGDEKKADKDAKPTEKKGEKKVVHMTVVVDAGNGPITIPIDGNAGDIGKEIEKAMKKVHAEVDAGQKQRAQQIQKAMELLKGDLSDEQIKQLQKHIEAMRAQKSAAAEKIKAAKVYAGALKLADDAKPGQEKAAVEAMQIQLGNLIKQGQPGQNVTGSGNMIFAVPAGGSRLGTHVKKPSPDLADQLDLPKDQGLVIVEVVKDSAAAKAGLKANDIILQMAGKPVHSDPATFVGSVRELKADEEVVVIVLRKGHKEKMSVTVPEAKMDGPVMHFQEAGPKHVTVEGKFDVKPEIKHDGPVNFEWRVVPQVKLQNKPNADDGDKPAKIERKETHQNRSVSITVSNDVFKAEQTEGDVAIRVTGKINGDKMEMGEVTIVSPDGKATYKKIGDVPSKYRATIKQLLANTDSSPVRAKTIIIDKQEEK